MRKIPIAIRKMINLPQQSVKGQQPTKTIATNQLINGMRLISRRITSLSLIHPWRPSLSRTCRPQRRETANRCQKPHSQSLCSVDVPAYFGSTASLLYCPQTRLLGTRARHRVMFLCTSKAGQGTLGAAKRCLDRQVDARLVQAW